MTRAVRARPPARPAAAPSGTRGSQPARLAPTLPVHEPDLIDRLFDLLAEYYPELGDARLHEMAQCVRAEFGGDFGYVAKRSAVARRRLAAEILALFNGRNATEVARRLGISRPTVYRYIKQAGHHAAAAGCLSFYGIETVASVRSAPRADGADAESDPA